VSSESATGDSGAQLSLLEPLLADPMHAAVLTDVDGTLAPIVARPEQAAVPAGARAVLEELSRRFGLVGCVAGRQAL
jgi:trehalose 6-phosphate phosphatase